MKARRKEGIRALWAGGEGDRRERTRGPMGLGTSVGSAGGEALSTCSVTHISPTIYQAPVHNTSRHSTRETHTHSLVVGAERLASSAGDCRIASD